MAYNKVKLYAILTFDWGVYKMIEGLNEDFAKKVVYYINKDVYGSVIGVKFENITDFTWGILICIDVYGKKRYLDVSQSEFDNMKDNMNYFVEKFKNIQSEMVDKLNGM